MTAMVEDSEEELPDLAVIMGKHAAGAESKVLTQCSVDKTNATSRSRGQDMEKGGVRLLDLDLGADGNGDQLEKMDVNRPKSRKRVLKTTSNNPFLRPLQSQRGRLSSRSLSSSSNIACAVSPMGLRVCREAKSTRRVAVTSELMDENCISANDTAGLSDFIVDDSSYMGSESAEESPQSRLGTFTRKLVRGRKHSSVDSLRAGQSETAKGGQLLQGAIIEPLFGGIETDGQQLYTGSGKSNNDEQKSLRKLGMQTPKYRIGTKLQEDDSSPEPYERSLLQSLLVHYQNPF
jgi:hypothetical protein